MTCSTPCAAGPRLGCASVTTMNWWLANSGTLERTLLIIKHMVDEFDLGNVSTAMYKLAVHAQSNPSTRRRIVPAARVHRSGRRRTGARGGVRARTSLQHAPVAGEAGSPSRRADAASFRRGCTVQGGGLQAEERMPDALGIGEARPPPRRGGAGATLRANLVESGLPRIPGICPIRCGHWPNWATIPAKRHWIESPRAY